MELELSRVDYTVVGLTSTNCLKLLPSSGPKHQQKVAVADHDGILQVFSIKKEDIQIHFKTLPGAQITSIQCGGASGTIWDKIFITSNSEVRGYTKKGKLFLSFDTNMTEPIMSMYVHESDLLLCGKHVYSHYRDCKDVGSYLCGDCIVDVIALPADKNRRLTSIIACEGRMIRVLEHSRVIHSIELGSAPVVLHLYLTTDDSNHILFGTTDGQVGVVEIDRSQSSYKWLIKTTQSSPVSCMDSYDLTGDGVPNLIIGRQDGSIEVYNVNILDENDTPVLIFTHNCSESVTAVQGGVVGNQGYDEILVSTYTGRIFGLTSEIIDKNLGADNQSGNYIFASETSGKIIKLKQEITELEAKVVKERERYQQTTQPLSSGVSAIPMLPLKDSMLLNKDDASYTLSLEVPTAIDNVLLQSDVPINLLDVEKNSAVVSHSDSDPKSGNYLLVAYRCQVNTNRLEIKIRTIEGQYGKLQAYVTPIVQPKCCQLRNFDIKPLSLHMRVSNYDEKRPFNVLSLKGSFSLAEMHTWLMKCFPEVPEKPQFTEKNIIVFRSVFSDTIMHCSYCKGAAEFKSENVSTISILKEFLTKEATKKKIKLDLTNSINEESIRFTLNLLIPKLKECQKMTKKLTLLEALHELEITDDENINYLTPKYKQLLNEEKDVKQNYNSKPAYLDRLYGIITDLYVDYNKFKGINAKSKIPQLVAFMDKYDFDQMLLFFLPNEQLNEDGID